MKADQSFLTAKDALPSNRVKREVAQKREKTRILNSTELQPDMAMPLPYPPPGPGTGLLQGHWH